MTLRVATALVGSFLCSCAGPTSSAYPQALREIPREFRGSWDEIVEDGCADRESRFLLEANQLFNFEVPYNVLSVTQTGPVDIEVRASVIDEFGGPADETWYFKLVENGQALSAPDGKPPYFKRCQFKSALEK